MAYKVREYTNKIISLIDDGSIADTKELVEQLLCWLSESEVKEFWYANGYADFFEDDDNEEYEIGG